MNRRSFLCQSSAALCAGANLPQVLAASPTPATPRFRIGTCTLDLARALKAGLEGVEIGVGGAADQLSIAEESVRLGYKKAIADLKLLKGRIAQLHFKNGPKFLDEEPAKFEPIAAAVKETGYRGWVVLETSSPSGDPVADARRNGDYLRKLLA